MSAENQIEGLRLNAILATAVLGLLAAVYFLSRCCPRHTRVTLEEAERRYPQLCTVEFPNGRTWSSLRQEIRTGDTLRIVASSPIAWRRHCGMTVLEVLRERKVFASIILERN